MKLPIEQVEKEIKESILGYDITFIVTPTSSGKTLLTPKYMNDLFGGCVYCTVPRVPIAKRSAASANQVVWAGTKKAAGYTTGKGSHKPQNAAVIYATEGSVLGMLANGFNPSIIMFDEAHEQGVFMEALLRKAKDIVGYGGKVVIASATIDSERYCEYYRKNGISVNVVSLPKSERAFKQHFMQLKQDEIPAKMVAEMANKGHRCLVGLSGKREIETFIERLKSYGCKTPIFPFHSEIEEEEQEEMDKCRSAMVIVATNILQSGVTLPQVSVGYFEGEGKQMVRYGNANKLITYLLSKSEMEQWYGRLGRTCDGLIFTNADEIKRTEMPIPEIQRVALEDAILQLANIGIDIFNADLLNQPEEADIYEAANNLEVLGLLQGKTITELGKKVLFAGAGIRAGIINVLGAERGVSNTAEKISAILNIGSPFRRASFKKDWYNKESLQSDLLIWKDVIETLSDQFCYDGKIEAHKGNEFMELCESRGIFRRSIKKLFRSFAEIDKIFTDTLPNPVAEIVDIIFQAYPDCVDKNYNISDARESMAMGSGYRTGSILSIGRAVFFEHVTYQSVEEK